MRAKTTSRSASARRSSSSSMAARSAPTITCALPSSEADPARDRRRGAAVVAGDHDDADPGRAAPLRPPPGPPAAAGRSSRRGRGARARARPRRSRPRTPAGSARRPTASTRSASCSIAAAASSTSRPLRPASVVRGEHRLRRRPSRRRRASPPTRWIVVIRLRSELNGQLGEAREARRLLLVAEAALLGEDDERGLGRVAHDRPAALGRRRGGHRCRGEPRGAAPGRERDRPRRPSARKRPKGS